MPTLTLTQAAVDKLKARQAGGSYWDSQLPGFGLGIAASRRGKDEETARRTWQVLCIGWAASWFLRRSGPWRKSRMWPTPARSRAQACRSASRHSPG